MRDSRPLLLRPDLVRPLDPQLNRRRFLRSSLSVAGALSAQGLLPAWARSAGFDTTDSDRRSRLPTLSGTDFDLAVTRGSYRVAGRSSQAILVNGTIPAPLLRWREGDVVTMRVHNKLHEPTSIHWHGILLPYDQDGVPGVSFPGIPAGETFEYRFPVRQAGTYWYHSHSGMQEQLGHYGPLIIDPKEGDPVAYDREVVLVLSDWTHMHPRRLLAKLKKNSESLNFQKRTLRDLARDARSRGLGEALAERRAWGAMRMMPTDIADVTGATYTYLVNGHAPADAWTALFEPGERVRLRIINGSAMSIFNVRIPGLPMTIVQTDGIDVQPVEVEEFQIGTAETYDAVVVPSENRAYAVVCESIDSSGQAIATLAPRAGMKPQVPALRARPLLSMKDMAMRHDMDRATHQMQPAEGDHSAHAGHGQAAAQTHDHPAGPGVANLAEEPSSRLHEPGIGLDEVPHRTLRYADLRSLDPVPDTRAPEREIEIHLTSNMERYMWSFDGRKYSEASEPIVFRHFERLRMTLVNDTMMPHPIHLHGMYFDVVVPGDEANPHKLRKHTVLVKPGEKMAIDISADALGDWAFHCHLLYHMAAGMFRVISVRHFDDDEIPGDPEPATDHHHDHEGR